MLVVSAREFRTNQTAVLTKARNGESVLLTSRVGTFKIVPVTEEDTLTDKISRGLRQVKMIQEGKLKGYSVDELLNEI